MEHGQAIRLALVEHSHVHVQLLEQEHAQHLTVLLTLKQVALQKLKASHVVQQLHGIAQQILAHSLHLAAM
jgi:hypothetical protein